ncbi:hypothetical protein MMC25_002333 [Agyrium rufum]|nr:hypothetical protein [Agyrium rufum]
MALQLSLPVRNLDASLEFYERILTNTEYRCTYQSDDQIGFGIHESDFFIHRAEPNTNSGGGRLRLFVDSKDAVVACYNTGLAAGGGYNHEPAEYDRLPDYFTAGITDLDRNTIEVVYQIPRALSMANLDDFDKLRLAPSQISAARTTTSKFLESRQAIPSPSTYGAVPVLVRADNALAATTNGNSTASNLASAMFGVAAGLVMGAVAVKITNNGEPKNPALVNSHVPGLVETIMPMIKRAITDGPPPSYVSRSPLERAVTEVSSSNSTPSQYQRLALLEAPPASVASSNRKSYRSTSDSICKPRYQAIEGPPSDTSTTYRSLSGKTYQPSVHTAYTGASSATLTQSRYIASTRAKDTVDRSRSHEEDLADLEIPRTRSKKGPASHASTSRSSHRSSLNTPLTRRAHTYAGQPSSLSRQVIDDYEGARAIPLPASSVARKSSASKAPISRSHSHATTAVHDTTSKHSTTSSTRQKHRRHRHRSLSPSKAGSKARSSKEPRQEDAEDVATGESGAETVYPDDSISMVSSNKSSSSSRKRRHHRNESERGGGSDVETVITALPLREQWREAKRSIKENGLLKAF